MDDLSAIARTLSPSPVVSVHELNKGGNSRIYRVDTENGTFALKQYPKPSAHDPRNRLLNEAEALDFMHSHSIRNVPRIVAYDLPASYGLLSWCDGLPIARYDDADMARCATFLCRLADASLHPEAGTLPYASEACVSGSEIIAHIEKRLSKLSHAAQTHTGLMEFLSSKLLPTMRECLAQARSRYNECGLSFDNEIPRSLQVLIPSDFGSHNALRNPNGLTFLDFEYFGWDDPATSTANFVLHPAMQLSDEQKRGFIEQMHGYFSQRDPLYDIRLGALLPLYAIRWCMIILGEFIPERWQHRIACGQFCADEKEAVLAMQLAKAQSMLDSGCNTIVA